MLKRLFIYLFLTLISGVAGVFGQNNTSSPYSRYGYGTITDFTSSQGRGMGGLSVGLRHNQYVNFGNPACNTAIDTLTFRFELGASMCSSFRSDGDAKSSNLSGNLEILALQFPIKKWLGFSMGLMPYSVVGYNYCTELKQTSTIEGSELKYSNTYKGEGGINQLMFGLGFRPAKPFSFGANFKLMFGTITTTSLVSFSDAANSGYYHSTLQTNKNKIRDFSIDFGAQYEFQLQEEKSLVVGVTVTPKSKLNSDASKTVETTAVDTSIQNFDNAFDLPFSLGAGVSYKVSNKLLVGFDYKFQKWSDARYFDEYSFEDRHKFVAGAEILPDYMSKKYFRRVSYRLGYSTANTYYKVNNDTYQENVLSAGFGFPLKRGVNPTILNFTIEYGFSGISNKDILQDHSLRFVLSATMNERWFVKRRLE